MNETSTAPKPLRQSLDALLRTAISSVANLPEDECDPIIAPAKKISFGDYQSNAMMGLAKKLGKNPRALAEEVGKKIKELPGYSDLLSRIEIAGPGFLNLYVSDEGLVKRVEHETIFLPRSLPQGLAKTVAIDYSSPNIAKEMHVGHIRSTILGDAIARILEFLGHKVIRQNHLGDWGTPFGMLIAYYRRFPQKLDDKKLSVIEDNYREANHLFSSEPSFEAEAKQAVVSLHHGEPEVIELWKKIVALSKKHLEENYARLGINLKPENDKGESFYNPRLQGVVDRLKQKFAASKGAIQVRLDDGATCIYMYDQDEQPLFKNKDGDPLPFIIQKSDGAFLYATTDLAALEYRVQELKADWIIIVTDHRQTQQMAMMFSAARLAQLDRRTPESTPVRLQHITFGAILGSDHRPLKTRDGGTIKLSTLIDEAVEQAEKQVTDLALEGGLSRQQVAEKIGIGAIKYADLSQNRQTDYIFSWEKLLSLKGNTAPYFSFAYARCCSIIRKSEEANLSARIKLIDPHERNLAVALCRFPEALDVLPKDWQINLWTDYLYNLASACMLFLENCRVLNVEDEDIKLSRLHLCAKTAEALRVGLGLLGIELVDRM